MRRLTLISATALLAFLLLVPPAWAEWVWPVRGEVITPYRNGTDPYASGQHRGIDIAAGSGTTVVAAAGGVVRFAGTAGSSGLTVSVRTADGRYDTSYLHLSSTNVREGDQVGAGQRLGSVGSTGTRSVTAPHLHFGVRDAGSRHAYHDPLGFLPPPTATQPPRDAPAPAPSPVPVSPAPAPVRTPPPSPHRVPGEAPRRVPVGHPRRAPAGDPQRVPLGEPQRVPLAAPRQAPAGDPGRAPLGDPQRVPLAEPRRTASPAPHGGAALEPRPHPVTSRSPSDTVAPQPREVVPTAQGHDRAVGDAAQANASPDTGPDLGLLAACLGLLAAAALLGLTGDGRKATRQTRHRIARVLQPMLGRR
jgi:peptidase M23-like protein